MRLWGKYSSVFWAPIWPSYLRSLFVPPLSHITHHKLLSLHVSSKSKSLRAQSFQCFQRVLHGLFKHYKSGDQTENERKQLIQPIILFPVQSIGKYQIPSSRPPWFSFQGLKCGNAKGVGWKKSAKIGHNLSPTIGGSFSGKGQRKLYRHFITSTPLLRMHLFGKSAQWWFCFLLQQFKTENKIRAWKYTSEPH